MSYKNYQREQEHSASTAMEPRPWISCENSPGGIVLTKHDQSIFPRTLADVKPTYITMIGRKTKATLLAQILATRTPRPAHNQVYLCTTSRFQIDQTPVVMIDSEIHETLPNTAVTKSPANSTARSWKLELSEGKHLGSILCDRIFTPFSSVICFFASDLGGQKAVARWLALQTTTNPVSDLRNLPRVLVVVETTSATFDDILAESRFVTLVAQEMQILKEYKHLGEVHSTINQYFTDIKILGLKTTIAPARQAQALKQRLKTMSVRPRSWSGNFENFRLRHLDALSQQVLQNLCSIDQPFSFAAASRPYGFSTDGFQSCLQDCLERIPSEAWLWHFIAPIVASALLLSSYPPGSHRK